MVIKQTKKAAAAARQDNHEKKSKAQIRRDKCDDQDTVTVHKASGKIPRQLEHHKAKVLLELFAGTGSVGKAFRLRGWQVVSLDISDEAHPDLTYKTDIRDWNYKAMFKKNHFTAVWSSPPCTEYSIARTTARTERNLTLADSLVAKAIEIADHFQPRFFFLENPQSGMLKSRPVMVERNMDYRDIDYCTYGAAYRKRTRIWGVRLQTLSRPQGFRNGFWEGRWQSWKLCGVRMLQQPSFSRPYQGHGLQGPFAARIVLPVRGAATLGMLSAEMVGLCTSCMRCRQSLRRRLLLPVMRLWCRPSL